MWAEGKEGKDGEEGRRGERGMFRFWNAEVIQYVAPK